MPPSSSPALAPRPPYAALRHADFRNLWVAQIVSLTGSQMQAVAINWHVYLLTGSPLALGMVGLTRAVPIIGLSLAAGVVADRRDRRRIMFHAQVIMTLIAATLALLTLGRRDHLFAIYALNLLSAAAVAFDGPARQALVPRLVPKDDLPGALSLNLTAFHAAMIGGPGLAGLLIAGGGAIFASPAGGPATAGMSASEMAAATRGLGWIYALNALSFVATLISLATMHPDRGRITEDSSGSRNPVGALLDGLRFVFSTPLMVWTMALDFFATLLSGATTLLPVFADRLLQAGPVGYGLLAAAPAVGALAGSIYTSVSPLPRRQGRVFLWSVAVYGGATVIWGVSRSFALTFVVLAVAGLADLISTVIRQTLRQLITPDSLRGRMTAINMIFFMGGPQLGELEAGLVASLFASKALGVTVSVVSGGIGTLLVTAIVAAATPVVRNYDLAKTLTEAHPPRR